MSVKGLWKRFLFEDRLKTAGIVVCLDKKGQFLVIRRSHIDERGGQWTLPGGHIDENDNSIEEGALRELYEEANLECQVDDLQYLDKMPHNKYYFLTQKWVGEVNVDKPNPETGQIEHDDYRWATLDEIKDIEDTNIPIYLLEKALEMSKNETDT